MRQSLLDFHKKWYSSNIMTLVVYSKRKLDSLEKWVKTMFSSVINKNVIVPDLGNPLPFTKNNLNGRVVKFVPIKDLDLMTLVWIMPYYEKDLQR